MKGLGWFITGLTLMVIALNSMGAQPIASTIVVCIGGLMVYRYACLRGVFDDYDKDDYDFDEFEDDLW